MRIIFLLIALTFSTIATAVDFELKTDNTGVITHESSDWVLTSKAANFDLYVNHSAIGSTERVTAIYSVVEFHQPGGFRFEALPVPVKRIYSFGLLECKNGIMNLLASWYVDTNNKIVYNQSHSLDSYLVDMREKNTSRNDLFRVVCANNK